MLVPLNLWQFSILRIKIVDKRTYLLDFNTFLWQCILRACVHARLRACFERLCLTVRVWTRLWLRACARDCVCSFWEIVFDCARVNEIVTTLVCKRLCVCFERLCLTTRAWKRLCARARVWKILGGWVCVCVWLRACERDCLFVCVIFSLPREGGCRLL
jgi:hypothetical protein